MPSCFIEALRCVLCGFVTGESTEARDWHRQWFAEQDVAEWHESWQSGGEECDAYMADEVTRHCITDHGRSVVEAGQVVEEALRVRAEELAARRRLQRKWRLAERLRKEASSSS